MRKMRTAIFGGSFNPIHKGHVLLAREVLAEKLADEVWLLVSPHNPLKDSDTLLDENIRFRLAETALQNEPFINASDFEFSLPRPSYTWTTLRALVASFPERDFSLLIGADNWLMFPKWAHPKEIISHHPIIIYPREGFPINTSALPPTVSILSNAPIFPFSSTDVRRAIACGDDVSGMLPASITNEVYKLYAKFGEQ